MLDVLELKFCNNYTIKLALLLIDIIQNLDSICVHRKINMLQFLLDHF